MPSLLDALDSISAHSRQISHFSSHNTSPAGPFVQAYLYQPTVNGLIRDAFESESRLFKFVGQVDGAAGGVVKKVEKRDGELTPLREYKRRRENREQGGNGRDEVEAMLRVALKLVDDYRPMPRARAHIAKLLAEHQRQLERIDELEQLIADASGPSKPASTSRDAASLSTTSAGATAGDQSGGSTAAMSPEDAIKHEEASLRALDASLAELRRARPPSPPPNEDASPERTPPASPPRRARPSVGAALSATPRVAASTPASKTPRHNITNALVNGATPARSRPTIDRFSPLRYLGTPRGVGRESGLRNLVGEEEGGRRSIFGGKALHLSTASSGGLGQSVRAPLEEVQGDNGAEVDDGAEPEDEVEEEPEESAMDGEDETVRFVPHQQEEEGTLPDESMQEPEQDVSGEASGAVAGVDVELVEVKAATEKIWATLPDLMAYTGSKDQTPISADAASIVAQLHTIATSDIPPPPSPSSASSLSALASLPSTGPRPAIITSSTILLAHLCVLLLRAYSDGGNGTLDLAQAKELLSETSRARGWDAENDVGTKTVYAGVGKRVFKLDRRGGGSGRIGFAL